ncbi:MAG: penicillin-binding transpeptidase domain-containing protein [Ruminococcus sp.]|nr:penicillin-binding transpeptidase domain-containing protein [Ruminococcus sp.]
MSKVTDNVRFVIIIIITLALMSLGAVRIMKIQLVDGSAYLEKSKSSRIYEQVISAPRGEIADAKGNYLVGNKSGFNVMLEKAFFPADNGGANRVILTAAEILATEGIKPVDELPITENPPFEFLPDRESDIARLRKNIGVQVYGTAEDCIIAMARLYGIDEGLSDSEKRLAAGVRYSMALRDFSVTNRYTFAEDIPMTAVVKIKEKSDLLDGVDISQEAVRVTHVGDVVPHLIGTVGAISAEEYEELKEKGYALNDTLGKGGIERAMEDILRGEKGIRRLEISEGIVIGDETAKEAVPGNTIKLTVDSDYQRQIQTILENHITWLNNQTSVNAKGTEADAGAIVVLNAKTGGLLAAATYPTYDLKDYIADYHTVASGENAPLTNRATAGEYRPGSTFKTVTATAALNEGVISPDTVVNCQKYYTYWEDWKPYPECTGYHSRLNVVGALRESCNIFFYEVGRVTGINTIAEYAALYGLGEEMGLETGRGVKKGYVASPEVFESLQLDWQAGNVIQAAIGQSDTAVTPLQMAAQAMTVGNKGVRWQTYMVDSVYTYNMERLVSKTEPVKAAVIEDKTGYTFSSVIKGMEEAAAFEQYTLYPRNGDYYTSSYLLTDLPDTAAIKTGTPQKRNKDDTSSAFIGFYPSHDPEIAFAGYVEKGEWSKFMVKDIINAYYNEDYYIPKLREAKSEAEMAAMLADMELRNTPKVPDAAESPEDRVYDDVNGEDYDDGDVYGDVNGEDYYDDEDVYSGVNSEDYDGYDDVNTENYDDEEDVYTDISENTAAVQPSAYDELPDDEEILAGILDEEGE